MPRDGLGSLVSSLAVALCAAAVVGAQPSGPITGSVSDPTNAPLANVTIEVQGPDDRVKQSGADGAFIFEALDGEYEVRGTLAGFAPAEQKVRLAGGERQLSG